MTEKEVYKFDAKGNHTVEMKECHPRKLAFTSKYIAPYWYQAFRNVFEYQKRRDLNEMHKLVDDSRIARGLKLYQEKAIIHNVVTTVNGGDVHATVKSGAEYTVIIKNYLPPSLPQFNYEREEYIANLHVDCTCQDHILSHYKDNSAMFCKHICCIIFFLMAKFNMPVIFVSPDAKQLGYEKSDTEEIVTNIQALPLVKFTQYINILLLKQFRGIPSAVALSIHKINNETQKEDYKPQWLTYVNDEDVEAIITGFIKAYKRMQEERKIPMKETEKKLQKIIGKKSLLQKLGLLHEKRKNI